MAKGWRGLNGRLSIAMVKFSSPPAGYMGKDAVNSSPTCFIQIQSKIQIGPEKSSAL